MIATILDLQQLFIFIYYTTSQVISFISINGSMTCYMLLLCQCPHLEGTMNIFLVLVKTHHYCQYSDLRIIISRNVDFRVTFINGQFKNKNIKIFLVKIELIGVAYILSKASSDCLTFLWMCFDSQTTMSSHFKILILSARTWPTNERMNKPCNYNRSNIIVLWLCQVCWSGCCEVWSAGAWWRRGAAQSSSPAVTPA